MRAQCETIMLQPVGNLNKARDRNYLTINSALCFCSVETTFLQSSKLYS